MIEERSHRKMSLEKSVLNRASIENENPGTDTSLLFPRRRKMSMTRADWERKTVLEAVVIMTVRWLQLFTVK